MGFIKSKEYVAGERQRMAGVDFRDVQQASVVFQTSIEAAQRLLPPPFEPADSSYPTGGIFVAHFGDTSFGIAYEECGLWLDAVYEGVVGSFWVAMTLNSDMGLVLGRERFGLPKKMADVQFRINQKHISGSVSRRGSLLLELDADLSRPCNDSDFQSAAEQEWTSERVGFTEYNIRNIPSPDLTSVELGPQLIRSDAYFTKKSVQFGHADLKLFSSRHDPYEELAVERILGVVYVEGDYHLPPGQVRAKLDSESYAPWSFMNLDDLSDSRAGNSPDH